MKKYILLLFLVIPFLECAKPSYKHKSEEPRRHEVELRINDLQYGTPEKRQQAAEVLGDLGDRSAVGPLKKALVVLKPLLISLKNDAGTICYFSAIGLGSLADPRAIEALKYTNLQDTNENVKEAARLAAAKIIEKNPE